MAKYLVTGGGGFIGSNIVRYILSKGHEAVVLDNFYSGKRENLADLKNKVELVEGDIRDRKAVDKALKGCTAIFHEAAQISVPLSVKEPDFSHDVNVNGTLNVLNAAIAAGVKRVVIAASAAAYGNRPESPKREDLPPQPISPYAANKLACEMYFQCYAASYGLETLCLRYFNVFGPYQDPNSAYAAAIPAFVSKLLAKQAPSVFGDGEQTRDFCYIENVCYANWLAVTAPAEVCNGQVLNIACGQATSINKIIAVLKDLLGSKLETQYLPPRVGDVKHSLADISLAKKVIGYEPQVYFEDGLRKSIDWYKKNLG